VDETFSTSTDNHLYLNMSLIIIPPLLFGNTAEQQLGINNNIVVDDGKLRNCICGIFTRSASHLNYLDHIFVLTRTQSSEETKFIYDELKSRPNFVTSHRVTIGVLVYDLLIFERTDTIRQVITRLNTSTLSFLNQDVLSYIKWYCQDYKEILALLEYSWNWTKRCTVSHDYLPSTQQFEYEQFQLWKEQHNLLNI
jgi:hypothetical protein